MVSPKDRKLNFIISKSYCLNISKTVNNRQKLTFHKESKMILDHNFCIRKKLLFITKYLLLLNKYLFKQIFPIENKGF